MAVLASTGRRRLLLAALGLAAGGYASCLLYKSSAFSRRRKQWIQIVSALSFLGTAVSQSAETLSILSDDLRSYLLSDVDTVPRSLRQAFKIGQCPEFRESVTVLSAALTQGLLRGCRKQGGGAEKWESLKGSRLRKRHTADQDEPLEPCREIREVGFKDREHVVTIDSLECEKKNKAVSRGGVRKGFESKKWNENELCGEQVRGVGGASSYVGGEKAFRNDDTLLDRVRTSQSESKPSSEDLPERMLEKLFSEPGVGFVSAVVGSLARNCVIALLDRFQNRTAGTFGDCPATDAQNVSMDSTHKKAPGNSKIVDVICTDKCRTLITECIQTVVSTAVTVYIDKTKDVNVYDDMIAGLTNPSHLDPVKDLVTSVCNGAIGTLVRTSHGMIFMKSTGQSRSDKNQQSQMQEECEVQDLPEAGRGLVLSEMHSDVHNELLNISQEISCQEITARASTLQSFTGDPSSSSESCDMLLKPIKGASFQGDGNEGADRSQLKLVGDNSSMRNFIDVLSKTLAVPSNRKLLLDVAGTMSSAAMGSLVDVSVKSVKSYFRSKGELQKKSRNDINDAAAKALLLGTICLAICLHILTGVPMLESV